MTTKTKTKRQAAKQPKACGCGTSSKVASLAADLKAVKLQLSGERAREGETYLAHLATESADANHPILKKQLNQVKQLWKDGHRDAARSVGDAFLETSRTRGEAAPRVVSLGAPNPDAARAKNSVKHQVSMLRSTGHDVVLDAQGNIASATLRKNRS